MGPDIPAVLKAVAADPYKAPAEPACETIPAELKTLDDVLGPDADAAPGKSRPRAVRWAGDWAGGAIRGLVPYRGVVRFLTGAGDKDKALTRAAMAGAARRGFLRGLEANMQCAAPTPAVAAAQAGTQAEAVTVQAPPRDVVPIDPGPTAVEPGPPPPGPILTSLEPRAGVNP